MKYGSILLLCCLMFATGYGQKNTGANKIVNGEVFLIDPSGSVNKLALVNVIFLTPEQLKHAIDKDIVYYNLSINSLNELDSSLNWNNHTSLATKYQYLRLNYLLHSGSSIDSNLIKEYEDNELNHRREASTYHRFVSDIRAIRTCAEDYADMYKSAVISDVSNSDGKFKVKLKNRKYWVFASATREENGYNKNYYWSFEYTPADKLLLLSNDNLSDK